MPQHRRPHVHQQLDLGWREARREPEKSIDRRPSDPIALSESHLLVKLGLERLGDSSDQDQRRRPCPGRDPADRFGLNADPLGEVRLGQLDQLPLRGQDLQL